MTDKKELTPELIESVRQCFRIMNDFAQPREGISQKDPTGALGEVYITLAQKWAGILKEEIK